MLNRDKLKLVRATARENGLVFKTKNGWINNKQAYKFTNRESGLTVSDNWTIESAFNECGYSNNFIQSLGK